MILNLIILVIHTSFLSSYIVRWYDLSTSSLQLPYHFHQYLLLLYRLLYLLHLQLVLLLFLLLNFPPVYLIHWQTYLVLHWHQRTSLPDTMNHSYNILILFRKRIRICEYFQFFFNLNEYLTLW